MKKDQEKGRQPSKTPKTPIVKASYVPHKDIENGIIIKAEFIRETKEAWFLDCEGDLEWFPKSQVNFDEDRQELEAPKKLLQQKFPDTKF